jgi:hypothetical protein
MPNGWQPREQTIDPGYQSGVMVFETEGELAEGLGPLFAESIAVEASPMPQPAVALSPETLALRPAWAYATPADITAAAPAVAAAPVVSTSPATVAPAKGDDTGLYVGLALIALAAGGGYWYFTKRKRRRR